MQFFIFVLIICFLIFLFCLYRLASDDLMLLRKDVSIEQVFNIAFLVALASLIGARIFYVALYPNSKFLNPLVFFLFPYFPGLSLTGGLIGGIIVFFLLTKKYGKIPTARLFDFFSISWLSTLALGFLGYFLLSKTQLLSIQAISPIVLYLMLFIAFIKILLPKLIAGNLKDGTIGFIFLISFSVISIVENIIDRVGKGFNLSPEDYILLFTLCISMLFLIKQEKLLAKLKKLRK